MVGCFSHRTDSEQRTTEVLIDDEFDAGHFQIRIHDPTQLLVEDESAFGGREYVDRFAARRLEDDVIGHRCEAG